MKLIKPYVYKATDIRTGEYYFGYRKANKVPANEDIGIIYFTSSKYINEQKQYMSFEIISEFNNNKDAYYFEQTLIRENWEKKLLLNKACTLSVDGLTELQYQNIGKWDQTTPEARKKRSDISKRLGLIPPNRKGIKQSDEHKKNKIESRKLGAGWNLAGANNGMYGKGHLLSGDKNGNAKIWKLTQRDNGGIKIIKSLITFAKENDILPSSLYGNRNKIFIVERV